MAIESFIWNMDGQRRLSTAVFLMCVVSSLSRGRTIVHETETITKKFLERKKGGAGNPMKKFSGGLSSREQYKVEASFLEVLSEARLPQECRGHRYFPSLVVANDTSSELTTSHDGSPIVLLGERPKYSKRLVRATDGTKPQRLCDEGYQRRNCSLHYCDSPQRCFNTDICHLSTVDLCLQLRCIAAILGRANVQHSDIHGGKNIAVKNGRLVLFDFDMAAQWDYETCPEQYSRTFVHEHHLSTNPNNAHEHGCTVRDTIAHQGSYLEC